MCPSGPPTSVRRVTVVFRKGPVSRVPRRSGGRHRLNEGKARNSWEPPLAIYSSNGILMTSHYSPLSLLLLQIAQVSLTVLRKQDAVSTSLEGPVESSLRRLKQHIENITTKHRDVFLVVYPR